MAKKYSETENRRAIDDTSVLIFSIVKEDEKNIENEQGGDEEEK